MNYNEPHSYGTRTEDKEPEVLTMTCREGIIVLLLTFGTLWLALNIAGFIHGVTNSSCGPMKRFEVVFPGIALGCVVESYMGGTRKLTNWLNEPLDK